MPYLLKLIFLILCLCMSAFAFASTTIIPEVNSRTQQTITKKQDALKQVTHITRKDMADSPLINLSELLKQEQSIVRVTHNSSNGSQPVLSIRGFGDNAVGNSLILVNGFPLTNPSLLAPNFNSIALSDIERIDIVQGSEGTLWGDQAVGGVVNIITRHPEKFLAEGTAALGSFNKDYFSTFVGNKFNNGLFFKAFGFTNQTNNYRQHNQQADNTLSAQVGMDYARGMISINLQTYHDSFHFPGSLTQAQFAANPRQATNFKNINHLTTNVYQFLNKHEINANWMLETRLAHHDIKSDGFTFFPFNSSEWMNNIGPRLNGRVGNNKIIVGFDAQQSHYQLVDLRTQVNANAQQNSIYAQTIVPVLNKIDVTLGGRSAWQHNRAQQISGASVSDTDKVFVTEQGLAFHLNNAWQVFIRRDGNFLFPKANEEVWTPTNATVLQPQTGVSYETGTIWHTECQTAQLNVYQLQLHDEIAFDPTQTLQQPFGSFENFADTMRRGITVAEDYHLTPTFTLAGQLNYVDARFASGPFSGKWIPAVPAWNGNVGVSDRFMQHWQARFDAIYIGSQYASEDVRNVGRQLPGYWLNSVAIQYMLKWLNISFEVMNLFNQQYSTYTLYNPVSGTNAYNPGAGRNYLLSLKVNV